jgi:predicted deacylase
VTDGKPHADPARRRALVLCVAAALVAIAAGWIFQSMHAAEPIIGGPGVTGQVMLAEFEPSLAGSNGDTPVFRLDGEAPGGTAMILGGTHPQEIAGMMAAILLVENARVTRGRLVVVPQANRSGFTYTEPMEAYLHSFTIETPGGPRWFRVGMRLTNPTDQWPDPDAYVHLPSGERMVGQESRNLNRNHPGLASGTLTARVSHGLARLAGESDVIIDLHETKPEGTLNNTLVAHENAYEIAAIATMMLGAEGIPMTLNPSPQNLHGLSHREFGDFTDAEVVLAETPNPAQGKFHGRVSEELVVGGRDPNYVRAGELGMLLVPFGEDGWPLAKRVARHLATIREVISAYNEVHPDNQIVVENIPEYEDVIERGLGAYLLPPPAANPPASP